EIHVVGEILPRSGDLRHLRLSTESSLRTYLTRDTRHFLGESAQLIHHGVHGVLELEDLALHIYDDLAVDMTFRDGAGNVSNAPSLHYTLPLYGIHVVGEILPRSCHARHLRLATKFSLRADLARDTSYF